MTRSIRHETIPYILGATGEGHRLPRDYPNTLLSWINYVFIDDDEAVRPWLLSNPVLEHPLDLLIYCCRPHNVSRELTPAFTEHNYFVPSAVTNWANEAIAQDQLPGGSFNPKGRRPEPRANRGPANEGIEPPEGDDSDALLVALSRVLLDVSGAGNRRESRVGMSSSAGGGRRESRMKHIPLALQSSSRLNIPHSAELGQHPAGRDISQKRRGLFDNETCEMCKLKIFCLASMAREVLASEDVRKWSTSSDDEDGPERKPKRSRSSP